MDSEEQIKEAIQIGHKHGLQNAEQAPNVIYILRLLSDQYSDLVRRHIDLSHNLDGGIPCCLYHRHKPCKLVGNECCGERPCGIARNP